MPLRAAIVGCGGISKNHAAAYTHLSSSTLVAVCDIDYERRQQRAAEFEVPKHYANYQEMFELEKLDVVSICTHAPLHSEIACAAADSGIHVLCEKPLALDLESADHMVEHCSRAGVHLAVSHQFRFLPALRLAKRLVTEGRIGALRCVQEIGKGRPAGFELMEMGVHYFDEFIFFMDKIEWINSRITFKGHEVTVDDIMHSRDLCTTDRRDNGLVAGDTMLIQVGGSDNASGLIHLYERTSVDGCIAGPHLMGETGQLMIKGEPKSMIPEHQRPWEMELWYCPSDVSFPAYSPSWEKIEIPPDSYLIEGRSWPGQPSIWSVNDILKSIIEEREPELGGPNASKSLECVSAVYESHFTKKRAFLPLGKRTHPLVSRIQP